MKRTEMKVMNSNNNAVTAGIFLAGAVAGITITAIGKGIKKLCSEKPNVGLEDDSTIDDDMADGLSDDDIEKCATTLSPESSTNEEPEGDSEEKSE